MCDETVASTKAIDEREALTGAIGPSSTPAMCDCYDLRQAQALHHFLHPTTTLPDEAAVERSPNLSSVEDDEFCIEGGVRSPYQLAAHFGAVSSFSPPWRSGSCSLHLFTLSPLPQPTVRLGREWKETSVNIQLNKDVSSSHTVAVRSVSAAGERSHTQLPSSAEAPSRAQEAIQQELLDGSEQVLPPESTLHDDDDSSSRREEGENAAASMAPAVHLTTRTASTEGLRAAPALPSWETATYAQLPATTIAASARCTSSRCPSCERTSLTSSSEFVEPSRQHTEGSASIFATPTMRVKRSVAQGTPALVVWKANTQQMDGREGVAPFMRSSLVDNKRSTVVPIPMVAPHAPTFVLTDADSHMYFNASRMQSNMTASQRQLPNTYYDLGENGRHGRPQTLGDSSSSDSESEDVFDDNGGGTGCVFNVCFACCTWLSHLILRCCTCCRVVRRYVLYCLRGSLTQFLPWRQHVFSDSGTSGNENGVDDHDDHDDGAADTESQLHRPLLSSFPPYSAVSYSNAAACEYSTDRGVVDSLAPTARDSFLRQERISPPPLFLCTQTVRAVRALRVSEEESEDGGHTEQTFIGDGETSSRRNAQQQYHPSSVSSRSTGRFASGGQQQSQLIPERTWRGSEAVVESHASSTSRLRCLTKKLSRYSPYELYAYLNVFSTSEMENGRGDVSISPQTAAVVATAGSAHAWSSLAGEGGQTLPHSCPPGNLSPSSDRSRMTLNRGMVYPSASVTPYAAAASKRRRKELPGVSSVGQAFALLHYLGFVLFTGTVVVLAVFEPPRDVVIKVNDETACNRFPYKDFSRPDFSFSLICFLMNSVLAVRYAVRAVRYEKGGLLVVQVVIMLLQLSRVVYFLLFVADRYLRRFDSTKIGAPPDTAFNSSFEGRLSGDDGAQGERSEPPRLLALLLFTRISLIAGVTLFLAASLTAPWVSASFGWRRYAQGIVSVRLAHVRQRLTALQTCVQLDRVIILNACLTTLFLLDSWADQLQLLVVTGVVLFLYALLVPSLRLARHWWPLMFAGCVLLIVSGYFAALIGDSFQKDYQLRAMSSSPWYSGCYTEQLPQCLASSPVYFPISIYRDEFDCAQFNELFAATIAPATSTVTKHGELLRATSRRFARIFPFSIHSSGASVAPVAPPEAPHPGGYLTKSKVRLLSSIKHSGLHTYSRAFRYVDNTSDTYIPTFSVYHDYFRISMCSEACFRAEEERTNHLYMRSIGRCCGYYGQCRLKDAYRTYAVILLTFLFVFSYVVRVVLLAIAWCRFITQDDEVIDAFLQDKRERRSGGQSWLCLHSQHDKRDAVDGAGRARCQQQQLSLEQRCVNAQPVPLPNEEPLVWNVNQYDAWRYNSDSSRWAAELAATRTMKSRDSQREVSFNTREIQHSL